MLNENENGEKYFIFFFWLNIQFSHFLNGRRWQLIEILRTFDFGEVDDNLLTRWHILCVRDVGRIQHSLRCNHFGLVCMFVGQIDDFLDARLNDDFGTFVTREQCHVHHTILEIGRIFVEHRIHLCMTHVRIFRFQRIVSVFAPWKNLHNATITFE